MSGNESDDQNEKVGDDEIPKPLALTRASEDGGTRVDLGEDLLERTAMLTTPGTSPASPPTQGGGLRYDAQSLHAIGPIAPSDIADHMQSAQILMGEGIFEDAKRLLRRILLTDPTRFEARKMLEEIHATELKQIFGENDTPRRRLGGRSAPQTPIEMSADLVMRGLDHDLKLGIFGQDGGESQEPQLSIFADRAAMEEFGIRMDRDFAMSLPTERVDLGVAFMEMGLHDLAVRHFQGAVTHLASEERTPVSADSLLAASGLLAYALILGGRAFEATVTLQPLLNDGDFERARKVDLVYLMGRACEALGKREEALHWYAQAAEIEPGYRDTDERLGRGTRR